ncbi:MAG: SMC-Scp complex subunit ScpB [Clostridiales bacterium]|nr:SMC-Scp complex subunit ScpB [Clostridiales bacterium]
METQPEQLANILEAILFVAGEPVHIDDIQKTLGFSEIEIISAIDTLASNYDFNRRGLCVKRFGNHIQLSTRKEYASYVEQMLQPVQRQSLSQAAMETLALVAYRQPVTKGEIELVRGVKCDYSIQSLVKKNLIEEVGRKETLGRPILYGTTDQFLNHFGLENLLQLPPLPKTEETEGTEESDHQDNKEPILEEVETAASPEEKLALYPSEEIDNHPLKSYNKK